ncbi:heme d1 biosynthesis protein NirJ [Pseudomonas sp. ATCC 13867]|nr:heme d1 biosynthesis protein NirJ [Pseudomonas sp. ATCC 13867]
MLRISRHLQRLRQGLALPPARTIEVAPVVIWNLLRRCNLTCRHCYSISADIDFPGELDTAQAMTVLDDLAGMRIPALILSGGEPLLRPDLFQLSARAKELGLYVGLSSNGTLIDAPLARRIADSGYDYVGVSIDGLRASHDRFRRADGAFDRTLAAVGHLRRAGVKVGWRFTLTAANAAELPELLRLMREEGVDKFYLSHLNYSGRGARNQRDDAAFAMTREAMTLLFEQAWADLDQGREYVTGNNDADAPFLLRWAQARGMDAQTLRADLLRWGGNSSGVGVANIDNRGDVHPDTYWWGYSLGNVRQRPFSAIWRDTGDPLLDGLRQQPRPVHGRCAQCQYLGMCNGNTRIRAWQSTDDPWASDPGCYLSDEEIGLRHDQPVPQRAPAPLVARQPIRFIAEPGQVWLVGAGPGDPGLLTLKAAECLARAEVVVHDRLVSPAVLAKAPPGAERIDVGKACGRHTLSQENINRLLVRLARQGRNVVRLKGGDPLIFGRGGEELEVLRKAGIACHVVPGVTAAAACAAAAGIPLTHREHAQALVLVTGTRSDGSLECDWPALAGSGLTRVFYMGLQHAAQISRELCEHGCAADTPVALVQQGSLPGQTIRVGRLDRLAELAEGLRPPTLLVIGEVAALAEVPVSPVAAEAEGF